MEESIYNNIIVENELKMVTIKVQKLRLRAYIGFKKWETEKLQDLVINYSFRYNATRAVQTDAEKDVLDYKKINKSIIQLIDRQQFHLLEKVAHTILSIIRAEPHTRNIQVQVEKPNALRFTDNVLVEMDDRDMFNEVVISLGSNIDPEENVLSALEDLKTIGHIQEKTAFIKTEPQRFKEQPAFLNGAVLILTRLYYEDLKREMKTIESRLRRIRTGNKNGPRKIDLDVVVYNETIVDDEVYEYPFLKDFVDELKPGLLVENQPED